MSGSDAAHEGEGLSLPTRVHLLAATAKDYQALLAARGPRGLALTESPLAPAPVLEMLAGLDASIRTHFAPASWLIVAAGELVGLCSITRAPEQGSVDIGYGIAPDRHGRGIARAALGQVVEWARTDGRVARLTAETAVANLPSQRVLLRNGFIRTGTRVDAEDGELVCWERGFD